MLARAASAVDDTPEAAEGERASRRLLSCYRARDAALRRRQPQAARHAARPRLRHSRAIFEDAALGAFASTHLPADKPLILLYATTNKYCISAAVSAARDAT